MEWDALLKTTLFHHFLGFTDTLLDQEEITRQDMDPIPGPLFQVHQMVLEKHSAMN